MVGPSVANGYFVWLLFFFVSFCRGQITHVLMSFVAARGHRTDALLVLCGVWSWAIVQPASLQFQAWHWTEGIFRPYRKRPLSSWIKENAISFGSPNLLSNSHGGLDIPPRSGCVSKFQPSFAQLRKAVSDPAHAEGLSRVQQVFGQIRLGQDGKIITREIPDSRRPVTGVRRTLTRGDCTASLDAVGALSMCTLAQKVLSFGP